MRIDKYIWCVRLLKSRSLAAEECKLNKVLIDDVPVKASRELKVGQEFVYKRDGIAYKYQVKAFPKSRVGAPLVADYLLDITPAEEIEKKEFIQMAKSFQRKKGLGRPTKKERRDLEGLV